MPDFKLVVVVALSVLLGGCASDRAGSLPDSPVHPGTSMGTPESRVDATPSSVLLVSIDGFRADYLDLGIAPHLSRIAENGVRAEWLTPSYPTLTFPNHYSIVTGLRPDHHGIVQNTMRDDVLGGFALGNRDAVGDGRWWGGEPIWVAAERAGMVTATLFWPGSEAAIGGVRPARWRAFDAAISMDARVDTVLDWLGEPADTRPRFSTLYFDALDHESHEHGPDSPETHAAIHAVDAAIGRLLRGLAARGISDRVNLIVVSDHGMAAVPPDNVIIVEEMVGPADAEVISTGQSLGFNPLPGRTSAAEVQLLGRHPHYQCWRKSELPPRWYYGTHPRIPQIVCQTDEGWDAGSRDWLARKPRDHVRGSHGYDPALPTMRAIFLASGPAFRVGEQVPAFDNVDVYPLLARLLGVTPAPNDGDDDAMAALKPDWAAP